MVVKKVKLSRYHDAGAKGVSMYSSYSFLTSALHRDEWSASPLGRTLPRGRIPGSHRMEGSVGLRAGMDTDARGKMFAFAGDRTPLVQSVVRHYTD
jgi:hypothetical protein